MKTTPSPNFSDVKNAGFNLCTDWSANDFGGRWGTNFSFYFVQDRLWELYTYVTSSVIENKFDEVQPLEFALFKQKEKYEMWPVF